MSDWTDAEALIDPYDYFQAMESGSRAERSFHPARVRLVRDMTPVKGKQVLEVGSGTGCLAIPLAEAGARVVALDAGAELLATLRNHAMDRSLSIPVVQGDARRLPFADDSFDVVVVASLVHLVPEAGPLLREAERVCRGDGRLVVAGPWEKHPKSMTWVRTLLRGASADHRRYPFNVRRLRRLLPRSRFLGRKTDYMMGYLATTWVPDAKR